MTGGRRGAAPGPATRIDIGSIAVSGIDRRGAERLGPAIERAVADAARAGALDARDRHALHLDLPHGAGEREIAAALVRALGRR